ncbi:hypothetical protein HQ585_16140, partial [candidate division KSB1 bacterium]|nr:hypothetical protein [candidate division KSB1 bacterium]
MRIRTIILCLAIFLIEIQLVAQTVPCIPADRRVDWSNAGLLPNTAVTAEAVIHVDDYTGTDDQRVNFALSEARSYHQSNPNHLVIIHFSPRNYYFSNTIALTKLDNNTVFQGEGSDRTHLVFDQASSNSHCISLLGTDYPYYNLQDNIIIPKESYNLYGNWSSYEISNSNWIHFTESYFDYEHPVANEEYIVGQITLLLNVAGTLGEMKDAASKTYQDYDHGYPNQLRVRKIEPIMNVGFENFKLTRVTSQKGDGLNFKIQYAVNCWIKGIESQHTAKHHIVIYYSSHIEVSGNYFYDAVDLGGGGFGYGVLLYASTTNCLVENNIFKNLRHAMIVGGGANCNVYDYNYSREQKWDEDDEVYGLGIKGPDICIHGKYSYANLFEGNVADRIWLDAYHGTSGPYNTIFRNRTNQNEPIIIFNADYTNVIGNDKATTALHDHDNGLAWLAELFGVGHVIESRYCFDIYF